MREERVRVDAAVAAIAARQHGVLTLNQLYACGVGKSGVDRRVRAGRLHRIHRGVYAVGHPGLRNHGRWMAAVLAGGSNAVLSHRSAAELWGLLARTQGPVHISLPSPSGGRKRRSGLVVHRVSLGDRETTVNEGIPVTSPTRTLADLRRSLPPYLVRRATREAAYRKLDLGSVDHDGSNSALERDFLRLCRRHRLPLPEVNVPLGGFTVDFLWRGHRVVVETDSYATHRGEQAFRDDHERDTSLRVLGFTVLRFTDEQVRERRRAVVRALRVALARAP